MFPTLLARLAMIASILYYAISLCLLWYDGFADPALFMEDFLGISNAVPRPNLWTIIVGIGFSLIAIVSLGWAYWNVEQMLRGGRNHDFFKLSQNLRNTSLGLIGFWFGYNLLTGLAPLLMTMHLDANSGYEYDWDPLDIDVILLILGIALFAVSHAIHRAWMVEEENKQFL